jgi:hypothetical protein
MEMNFEYPLGENAEAAGEESLEDSMAPDCFPWPQDDTPDAKPEETLAAIDIHLEKEPPPRSPLG